MKKVGIGFLVVLMGILLMAGCTAPKVQEKLVPETPAAPSEVPEALVEEEALPSTGEPAELVPAETNLVRLVQEDGYVAFENKAIEVKKGSAVKFQYVGEKGRTVVNVYKPDGKTPVGKTTGSGYLISGQEWTTPSLDEEGVYVMKIQYGKADEGTITVE